MSSKESRLNGVFQLGLVALLLVAAIYYIPLSAFDLVFSPGSNVQPSYRPDITKTTKNQAEIFPSGIHIISTMNANHSGTKSYIVTINLNELDNDLSALNANIIESVSEKFPVEITHKYDDIIFGFAFNVKDEGDKVKEILEYLSNIEGVEWEENQIVHTMRK